jgi:hypothetical protein
MTSRSIPGRRSGPARSQQLTLGAVALAPLALGLLLWLVVPRFLDPLMDNRVTIAGAPLGVALGAVFALLTAVAVLIAVRVRSWLLAGLAVALLSGLAFYLVLLAPAIVLVVIGLGGS